MMVSKAAPVCGNPECMKAITDPDEQKEKTFLIEATGRVISLFRHDACALKYGAQNRGLRPVTPEDLKLILSPASAMKRFLDDRRKSRDLGIPTRKSHPGTVTR